MTVSFDKPTVFDSPAFIELGNKGEILRLYLEKDQHKLGRDPEWADLKVPVDWGLVSRRQAIFVREGNLYRIFDGDGTKSSTHGIFVNGTRVSASSGYLLTSGAQLEIAKSSDHILLTYSNAVISKPPENIVLPSNRRLVLKGIKEFPIKLGRAPNSDVYSSMQLDAPTVSRLHAKIYTNGNGAYGSLVDVNTLIPANTPTEIIKTSFVYSATWKNLGLNWGVLIIHISVCIGVSLWLQKRKDIV
ncbi:hypothetical protein DSM106972_060200 [Dulcicalothrix desertica PCC 7102]|uniref:FHA domain-containing protein n=1 Tax=Dulcicalothrix desertica PCC 7102 TaxID=232991 RepID=A0A3S1AJU2_9CYAN|nr:FHA domain-containing protein [Dulcicalothrix desertica]RUT02542.1 hypothetical protein DSM106972_060200 [Dulcicalothrix desertica PCC 7102]